MTDEKQDQAQAEGTEWPETVVCYYPPGRVSPLSVATELYHDISIPHAEYVRKREAVDAHDADDDERYKLSMRSYGFQIAMLLDHKVPLHIVSHFARAFTGSSLEELSTYRYILPTERRKIKAALKSRKHPEMDQSPKPVKAAYKLPEGWKAVPIDGRQMKDCQPLMAEFGDGKIYLLAAHYWRSIYNAMIAAAPELPGEGDQISKPGTDR